MTIRLASLDMAGTTVDEGGAVYEVLRDCVEQATRLEIPDELLASWTGTSKLEAIEGLLAALNQDVAIAPTVFARFSSRLEAAYADAPPTLFRGVDEAVRRLRNDGVRVALQTGYARAIAEGLLESVGWRLGQDVDALVAAEDVPASRPAPYLVRATMERTGIADPANVLVAGDTVNDLRAGSSAGARYVVGVLTGAQAAPQLRAAPHTHLVNSAADLHDLLASNGDLPVASRV